MTKQPKRAIIYGRLSPTPRGEEAKGGNLDQQVDLSQRRCDSEGWGVVRIITEKDTSATSKRPRAGWLEAVAMVKAGEADVIVARHYDRMYRQVRDLEDLCDLAESTGVELIAAETDGILDLTTASGRAQARYMAVGAALETELKRERQIKGHQRRVNEGRPFWGTRPFGFEKDGTHRVAEAEALRQAYSDLLAGHSIYGIAQRWNAGGLLSPRENEWRSSNLRTVILHPRNAGIHTYTPAKEHPRGKSWRPQPSGAEATWEPIVAREVYEAVRALLSDPSRKTGGGGKRKGLLTHIAQCGKCDGAMGQTWNRVPRKDGTRLRKYQCRECHGTSIDAQFLEDLVINRITLKADKIVAAKLSSGEGDEGLSKAEIDGLRAEQVRLGTKKDELLEDYNSDLLSREDMRMGIAKANARLEEIASQLNANATNKFSSERWAQDVEAMFSAMGEMVEDPSQHDELRAIIKDATTWVKVLPRNKGERISLPKDVDIKFVPGVAD